MSATTRSTRKTSWPAVVFIAAVLVACTSQGVAPSSSTPVQTPSVTTASPHKTYAFDRICWVSPTETTDGTFEVHGQVVERYILPTSLHVEEGQVYRIDFHLDANLNKVVTAVSPASPTDTPLFEVTGCPTN